LLLRFYLFILSETSLPIKIIVIKIKLKKLNSLFCCCIAHLLLSSFSNNILKLRVLVFYFVYSFPIKINVKKNKMKKMKSLLCCCTHIYSFLHFVITFQILIYLFLNNISNEKLFYSQILSGASLPIKINVIKIKLKKLKSLFCCSTTHVLLSSFSNNISN